MTSFLFLNSKCFSFIVATSVAIRRRAELLIKEKYFKIRKKRGRYNFITLLVVLIKVVIYGFFDSQK